MLNFGWERGFGANGNSKDFASQRARNLVFARARAGPFLGGQA
jgi:hypothetical protein